MEAYDKIQKHLIVCFVLFIILLFITSVKTLQDVMLCYVSEHAFYLIKVMPWGGFGAILYSFSLAAKDRRRNELLEADSKPIDAPAPFDVVMYSLYFLIGLFLAVLSAYLLEIGAEYISSDGSLIIKEKFGLFAIFAFYAGYNQIDIVQSLINRAKKAA